jgi:PAS domain S-box-containing protein
VPEVSGVKTDLLERLQAVLVHADEGFVLTNAEGIVEYVSPTVEKILGYTPDEVIGRAGRALFTVPEDVAQTEPTFASVRREPGKSVTFTSRMRTKRGEERWIESKVTNLLEVPSVRAMTAHFRDVTDRELARRRLEETMRSRREAETALERSEANFRALIEGTPVAVVVHRDDVILYANPALTTLLGWPSADALVGKPAFELVVPEFREVARSRWRSLLAAPTGTHTPLAPGAMVRSDGSRVDVEVESMKLDFDGAPACVVLARDISERRAMLARLSAADRLASLGTLAAGVAHEINNPLAYVLANLSLLSDSMPSVLAGKGAASAPKIESMLGDAREGAKRIQSLVRDLRVLAHPDRESVTGVDAREVIASCLRIAGNEIKQRARLVTQLADVPPVAGNEARLGQVVLNLVINAAQAIPEGRVDQNEIRISLYRAASGDVAIEVSDSGGGIPEAILGHIFDPFFTTKPIGVGTGLGLAICHGIVHALGGELTVENRIPHGATFRVILPVWRSVATTLAASSGDDARPIDRMRILVVDDEPRMCRTLELMWNREHEVATATSASVALERLKAGEPFDAIFCDLMMPGMTGMKFYEALSVDRPELVPRVVFTTGGAFTPASREFVERVPNKCLEKPFDMRQLDEILRTLGARAPT